MKYKLIDPELNALRNELSISHIVLRNRGIFNPTDYLSLDDGAIVNYRLIHNIKIAKDCLLKHVEQGSKIGILVDCDPDGYASATILYQYLVKNYNKEKLEYYLHTKKQHGLSSDIIIPNTINLLFIPDAGTNDVEQCKELKERGIDVIILDHHEVEKDNPYAIILNNQIGSYPNRFLSGCGVTKKFLEILDDEWWGDSGKFDDLIALSIISDSMSIKERENKRLVNKGLSKIRNKLFLALLEETAYSTGGVISITNVAFYIVPLLNALIRVGTPEDKELMFRAFIETDEVFPYKKPGKDSVETQEDIYARVARIANNAKAKQKRCVDKSLESLREKIQKYHWDQDKIMFVNADDVDWNYTGLVTIKIANEYNRPCLLLRPDKDGFFSGSARNYSNVIPDLKEYLNNTGMFESLQGHANAHGATIKKENIKPVIAKINEDLKNIDMTFVYNVDFEIDAEEVTYEFVREMIRLLDHYGQGIEESFVLVRNIKVNTNDIEVIGKENDTWKFEVDSGSCVIIKFKADKEVDEVLKSKNDDWGGVDLTINAIVKFNINSYNGIKTSQAIIQEFEIVK